MIFTAEADRCPYSGSSSASSPRCAATVRFCGIAPKWDGQSKGPTRRCSHSAEDRSLSIKLDSAAPDGFVVHSFANDDPLVCRDHVRKKLGLPEFEPKKKASGSLGKTKKGNGTAKPWSPIVARYVYRQADGTPYLQVCRTAAAVRQWARPR